MKTDEWWAPRNKPEVLGIFEHFTGAGVPAGFTDVTYGSGTVTVSDSMIRCYKPGQTDLGYIYMDEPIDITVSQLIMVSFINATTQAPAPALLDMANPNSSFADISAYLAAVIVRGMIYLSTVYYVQLSYYDSGGTGYKWQPSTSTWITGNPVDAQCKINEYTNHVIWGLEIDADGGNSRWRQFHIGNKQGSSYNWQQGHRMLQLSNWVNWSATRSPSNDMYLVLGYPIDEATHDLYVEFIRQEKSPRRYAFYNGKVLQGDTYDYLCGQRTYGKMMIPNNRDSTRTLALGAGGQWDDTNIKDPSVVLDYDGTYHLFYSGHGGSYYEIGHASSSNPEATFTKNGSNPLVSGGAGDWNFFPHVVKDMSEPDPAMRWKMLYSNFDGTNTTVNLATAPAPGGTWTKQGIVIDHGGGGDFDEEFATEPTARWCDENQQWEVWYRGANSDGDGQIGRAYGPTLFSLTKDPNNPYISWQADGIQLVTGDVDGRTITMTDTSGFTVGALCVITDDTDADDYSYFKIRKINANTSLETYMGIAGFTSANSPYVEQQDAFRRFTPRVIQKVGNEWLMHVTSFLAFSNNAGCTAFVETDSIWKHTGRLPHAGTFALDVESSPPAPSNEWDHERSLENISLTNVPVYRKQRTRRGNRFRVTAKEMNYGGR